MEALLPGGVDDAWYEKGGVVGQSEVDGGGDGQNEPEVDGGVALLLSHLPLLSQLFLLSLHTDRSCLLWADGAAG